MSSKFKLQDIGEAVGKSSSSLIYQRTYNPDFYRALAIGVMIDELEDEDSVNVRLLAFYKDKALPSMKSISKTIEP